QQLRHFGHPIFIDVFTVNGALSYFNMWGT
ncbi:MAG: hypothetical protein ACI85H_000678, partial [Paracoccaceae bacterium]